MRELLQLVVGGEAQGPAGAAAAQLGPEVDVDEAVGGGVAVAAGAVAGRRRGGGGHSFPAVMVMCRMLVVGEGGAGRTLGAW